VGAGETTVSLTVRATSTVDTTKSGTATVIVIDGGGTLTVLNYTSSAYAFVCTENDPPSSVTDLAGRLSSAIAKSLSSKSPFSLLFFTRTGTFSVLLQDASAAYFKGNVSFTNGSATIDFTSMTKIGQLPPY
jgi:broad specificity phosphatase PhoE